MRVNKTKELRYLNTEIKHRCRDSGLVQQSNKPDFYRRFVRSALYAPLKAGYCGARKKLNKRNSGNGGEMSSINPKTLLLLVSLLWFCHSTSLAQSDNCPVSIDMWLIGETCVISGLQLQYGEFLARIRYGDDLKDADGLTAQALYSLFPIGFASKPRDLGWFKSRFLIEFSPMQTWRSEEYAFEESQVGDYELFFETGATIWADDESIVVMDAILTEDQYNALYSSMSPNWNDWAAQLIMSYEYIGMGYSLETKYPFFRAGLGIELLYNINHVRIEVYEKDTPDINRLAVFYINSNAIVPILTLSWAVYEGDNLTLLKSVFSYSQEPLYYADDSSNEEIEFEFDLLLRTLNIVSFAFHF